MDSIQPSTHGSVDQLHHLDTVLEKHLPTLKAKKRSMIALHLSDIAGEMPNFEKCYTALVQSEEISEDDLADCVEELEISVLHMLDHMKDLKPLLKKAVNALPE
jgi:hypothetical protein